MSTPRHNVSRFVAILMVVMLILCAVPSCMAAGTATSQSTHKGGELWSSSIKNYTYDEIASYDKFYAGTLFTITKRQDYGNALCIAATAKATYSNIDKFLDWLTFEFGYGWKEDNGRYSKAIDNAQIGYVSWSYISDSIFLMLMWFD